jgi:predicted DNA-binding transcriptional regulator YafY
MLWGEGEELVTLECAEHLAGVMIDRFGKDVSFFKSPFGFKLSVRVMPSPNFYGWALGFGKDVKILSPVWVRDELLMLLEDVKRAYGVEK